MNEVLDCAKTAASSALHVQGTNPERFEQYHCRPDYSLGGKGVGRGPVMRLLPVRARQNPGTDIGKVMKLVAVRSRKYALRALFRDLLVANSCDKLLCADW